MWQKWSIQGTPANQHWWADWLVHLVTRTLLLFAVIPESAWLLGGSLHSQYLMKKCWSILHTSWMHAADRCQCKPRVDKNLAVHCKQIQNTGSIMRSENKLRSGKAQTDYQRLVRVTEPEKNEKKEHCTRISNMQREGLVRSITEHILCSETTERGECGNRMTGELEVTWLWVAQLGNAVLGSHGAGVCRCARST